MESVQLSNRTAAGTQGQLLHRYQIFPPNLLLVNSVVTWCFLSYDILMFYVVKLINLLKSYFLFQGL